MPRLPSPNPGSRGVRSTDGEVPRCGTKVTTGSIPVARRLSENHPVTPSESTGRVHPGAKNQSRRTGVLLVGLASLGVIFAVTGMVAVRFFFTDHSRPDRDSAAAPKVVSQPSPSSPPSVTKPTLPLNTEPPMVIAPTPPQPLPLKPSQAEEEKRKLAIAPAKRLEAPELGKGKESDISPFAEEIRDLVSDEFKLKELEGQVYVTRFASARPNPAFLSVGLLAVRNGVLEPGKYDFKSGVFSATFYLWLAQFDKSQAVPVFVKDECALQGTVKLDQAEAKRWRDAMAKKEFDADIWYRIKSVRRAEWKPNPHVSNKLMAHDIVIDIEILKSELSSRQD